MNKLSYRTWGVTLVMCTCYVCCACCCAGEVSQQVQHVVDSALPLMIKAFDTDDDKEAVTAAVLGCGVILMGAGAQACQHFMEPLATGASMVRSPFLNAFFCCASLVHFVCLIPFFWCHEETVCTASVISIGSPCRQ